MLHFQWITSSEKCFFCLSPWRGWSLLQEGGVRLSLGALRACSYKPRAEAWHQGKAPYSSRGFSRFLFPQQTHGFTGAPFICLFLCVPLMISILFSCILKMFFYNFAPEIQNDGLKTRLYDNKRCTETDGSHVWERWKRPKRLIISAFMRVFWQKSCISREYSLNLPT